MSSDDLYINPETGVFYNKLGLRSEAALADAERAITRVRLAELTAHPLRPSFDLGHFRAIHRHLFSDLCDWAGELRGVDIAKTDLFCRPRFIEDQARQLFGHLAEDRYLRDLRRAQFVDAAAHYLGEINALHPFREGNGRAQRAFLAQLADQAGHPLDWSGLDEAKNSEPSVASLHGDLGPLRRLLNRHLS